MIFEILLVLSLALAIAAVKINDLLHAVIVLAGLDITLALLFYLLAAPDIAITQAAVCAGVSTMVFVIAINKTERIGR